MDRFGVHAGRPSRRRLFVVLTAVLAMVSPVAAVSSAEATAAKASRSVPTPSPASSVPLAWRGITHADRLSAAKTVPLALRGVTAAAAQPAAAASRPPTILVTPSTAIGAETVKVTGKLPTVKSRPISIQRKVGTRWVASVRTKTTRTGSYAISLRAPAPGSYLVRTLAPRVRVAGRVRAQYVTSPRTLRVVAQAAALSMPATVAPGQTSTALATFRPVRAGRVVTLQVARSSGWVTVGAARTQSAIGTANLTVPAEELGAHIYRAVTAARAGAPAFAAYGVQTVTVVPDTTAPGPVSSLTATAVSTTEITLGWVTPSDEDFNGVTIRRATGDTPPATPTSGIGVTIGASQGRTSFIDTGLELGVTYSYAVFAHDRSANHAAAATESAITNGAVVLPSIQGKVTADAGGAPLAGVDLRAFSPSSQAEWYVTTGADGRYTFAGLPNAVYDVCAIGSHATGGSSDASGYLRECYLDLPMWEEPTPVNVSDGESTTGIDIALATGGAISGGVTVAAGANPVLAGVVVTAFSPTTWDRYLDLTAADGSYSLKGLRAGTDYIVCFDASGSSGVPGISGPPGSSAATGGPSDATGYVQQCWPTPWPANPTPVTVTVGGNRGGVDVALALGGAVSGKVTDAGGAHHGLAMVEVIVFSENVLTFATTAADGSYTVRGLPAATDYQVDFQGYQATGGSSDATGYAGQRWQNQSLPELGTPVAVTIQATTPGIDGTLGPPTPEGAAG